MRSPPFRMMTLASPSHRVCPLTERPGATTRLSYAPPPWVLLKCRETGFVFLENPPPYEAFKEDYAWEVTSKEETKRRHTSEPALHFLSTAVKAARRRILKRHKIRDLADGFLQSRKFP